MCRYVAFFVVLLSLITVGPVITRDALAQEPAKVLSADLPLEADFKWLFDKKTLEGWEGNADWFRIEDGCIVAGSLDKAIPHNEFLCTKTNYGNFELKVEVRLKGKGDNAGVQFRTVRIPGKTEVSGFQCDVGNAFGRPVWGALYDESRRNRVLLGPDQTQMAALVKAGDWNDYEIRAEGRRIRLTLNGRQTVDFTEDDPAIPLSGLIALQIHGGGKALVSYRNITIVELP